MSKVITKKVYSRYFDKILSGEKTYEVRLADWQCEPGDILELVDIDDETREPSGRVMREKVGEVIRTKEIEEQQWWPDEDVKKYGFQVIALVGDEPRKVMLDATSSDIAVCGSMAHKDKFAKVIEDLRAMGLAVSTPDMTEKTDWSSMSDEEVIREKGVLMRKHFANIATAKAVLVCNYEKNGTENYIGTNTLMEMTAGFVLEKPIYLLNPVPEQNGREEILAMQPIVIHGDLSKIEEVK